MNAGTFYLFRQPADVDNYGPGMLRHIRRCVLDRGAQYVKHGDYTDPKSQDQNAMWRGLCRDISEWWCAHHPELQTSPDAVARDLKVRYGVIVTEYSPVTDSRQARIKSTSEYTKAEMSALITATLAWAAHEGLPLPDPRST